jgi:hypothetical protein
VGPGASAPREKEARPEKRSFPCKAAVLNPSETHPKHPSAIRMGSRPLRPIAMRNSGVGAPRLRPLYEWPESVRLTSFSVRWGAAGRISLIEGPV